MLAELSYIDKVWNRGVDISVGVITSLIGSLIVGVIGLVFWRFKLRLDLRAAEKVQRQEHRVAKELEMERERREACERREQFRVIAAVLADQADTASSVEALADCWDHYLRWLLETPLCLLPGNIKMLNKRADWSHAVRRMQIVGEMGHETAQIIRNTELPPEE